MGYPGLKILNQARISHEKKKSIDIQKQTSKTKQHSKDKR